MSSRKIIGLVSFSSSGGPQEAMLRLMRHLRQRGHHTEVWFLYEKFPCPREDGVRVVLSKNGLSPLDVPRLFLRLVQMFRAAKPDAVVSFLPLANMLGMAAAAAAGVGQRVASQRVPAPALNRLMRLADRLLGVRGVYSKIVCVSETVRESFALYPNAYRTRLSVVHNGVEWRPSGMTRAGARESFGIPSQWPLLVATGAFVTQKNYDLMARVVATTPRVRLAVAGDGALRPLVERLAGDLGAGERIHFLGCLDHGRVMDLLRAADAFVQTSLYEGQSHSILEAMHEGLPIICSDIPTQRETVCEENGDPAAILVPLSDFEGWRSALIGLRDRGAFAKELGSRAQALVGRRFTLARMIDGFEEATAGQARNQWRVAPKDRTIEELDIQC